MIDWDSESAVELTRGGTISPEISMAGVWGKVAPLPSSSRGTSEGVKRGEADGGRV